MIFARLHETGRSGRFPPWATPGAPSARDAGVSQATGYRYLHEAIDVLAAQVPDLHQVLKECQEQGLSHLVLDGTLIMTDRAAGSHINSQGKIQDEMARLIALTAVPAGASASTLSPSLAEVLRVLGLKRREIV